MKNAEFDSGSHDDPPKVIDMLGADVVRALAEHDGEQLLDVIKAETQNGTLEALDLRVQLRDFWRARKGDVAQLSAGELSGGEAAIKAVITAMDTDLATLEDGAAGTDALVRELERRSADSRVAFMTRIALLKADTLSNHAELLLWTRDWRDAMVEDLWDVVRDIREDGTTDMTRMQATKAFRVVNANLDKLVSGSLNPEGS